MYLPTMSLADPPADSPIADGVSWIQGVALGTTATAIAVLAVAAIGLLMLSGRIELRRGTTVAIGCFILFGASSIAAALVSLTGSETQSPYALPPNLDPLPSRLRLPAPSPTVYDPYAGASVPTAR